MGYRIEGDASYNHTKIWKDDELIDYIDCTYIVDKEKCVANVDSIIAPIDRMILKGFYLVISDGDFTNTIVVCNDTVLRGIQGISGTILKRGHPRIFIDAVNMPNIIEEVEDK